MPASNPVSDNAHDALNEPENLARFRAGQRSRAGALALVLGGLVVLFYVITIVKIGTGG